MAARSNRYLEALEVLAVVTGWRLVELAVRLVPTLRSAPDDEAT